jgi:hypothetical protein
MNNDLESLIAQMRATRQAPKTQRRTLAISQKKLQVQDISVAYVVHNADGSFTQLRIQKTEIKAVWTTIVAETEKAKNSVTDLRLAPLDEWEDESRRKRNVYARGVTVEPHECLCKCLKQNPIENPVLLVVWERPPSTPTRMENSKVCSVPKQWDIILFTNSTDTTKFKGGPIILVHTASGSAQLAEDNIYSVASSAFIAWLQNKAAIEGWEIISLTMTSASVRMK